MATEQIPTTLIADDAVTNAKIGADAVSTTEIANDASISTSGNIATTGSGALTVAGTSTLTGALTASGGIANAGTITAGTLGANVVFNDTHKDIRKDDYILLGFAASTDYNSQVDITSTSSNLWDETYKGSGITHPYNPSGSQYYGKFKVSKAGLYLVWFNMHNDSWTDDNNEIKLRRNGMDLNNSSQSSDIAGNIGGRLYTANAAEVRYITSGTKIIAVPLNANDYLNLYGQGNFYGDPGAPMGQFGAIRLGDRV